MEKSTWCRLYISKGPLNIFWRSNILILKFQIFESIFLKKDDFSDLTVNDVCLALVQSFICHWPYVIANFLSLFVFKDSVIWDIWQWQLQNHLLQWNLIFVNKLNLTGLRYKQIHIYFYKSFLPVCLKISFDIKTRMNIQTKSKVLFSVHYLFNKSKMARETLERHWRETREIQRETRDCAMANDHNHIQS